MIKFNNADEPARIDLEKIEYGDMFAMKTDGGFEHVYLKLGQDSACGSDRKFKCFDMNQSTMETIFGNRYVRPLNVTIHYSYIHSLNGM